MTYSSEVLADSPTAFWEMDDTSGTTMVDSVGSWPGTYVGSPTLGATGLVSGGGTAVTFNGSNQYASVSSNSWMDMTTYTLECVFVTTATSGFILNRDNGNSSNKYWDIQVSGSDILFTTFTGSTGVNVSSSGATINDGSRHHVAVVVSGGTATIYIDGVSRGSGSAGTNHVNTVPINIGRRSNNTGYFAGTIDVVAIYPTALSGTRIAAHVAAMSNSTTGTLATTLAGATLAASGTEKITGTLVTTLAGATLSASGAEKFTGTLAATLDGATLLASGAESFTGSFAVTLDGATLAASGTETVTGTLSVTLEDVSLVATSEEGITGTLAATLEDAAFAAEGSSVFGASGVLEVTLDGALLSASGVETISGSFLVTLDGATLVATGSTHQPFRDIKVLALVDVSRLIEPVDVSRTVTLTDTPRELTITEEVYA